MRNNKKILSVFLAALFSAGLLSGCLWEQESAPSSSASPSSSSSTIQTSWSEPEADVAYNAEDGKISKEEYGSTILEKSEDAGQEYIDNTLFIGDSNTVRMMAYGHTTLKNTIGVISMGIQHVPTKKCVYFQGRSGAVTIPEAVAIMQPQRIVITYGTNNTIGWSSETFIEEYKEALKAITDTWPYADIIINSVPPVDKYRQNTGITMQTIDSFNKALAEMAEELGYKFLDSSEVLKDSSTGFAKSDFTYSDGVHLNKKAMEALFEYVRTHSYITEDRRPQPLKTVPERKETPPDIITEDPLAVRNSAEAMDDDDSSSSSSSKNKKGIPVYFIVDSNSSAMGYLEGKLAQTVSVGQSCSSVQAVAAPGYEFDSWGCTVGRISDVSNSTLSFSVPGDAPKDGITVYARFKPAVCTCTVQCAEGTINWNCKACAAGIGNCKGEPVATATPSPSPTPVPTVTPTPTPTATPEPTATPSPTPTATPEPTPIPPPVDPTASPNPEGSTPPAA